MLFRVLSKQTIRRTNYLLSADIQKSNPLAADKLATKNPSRCTILKGVNLPNGTIVGTCSLVNKKFEKENTLIAGTPARIIKENVAWVPYSYGEYMEKINNDFAY